MPQKYNPDVLELVRGKTAQVVGWQTAALTLLHGMPVATIAIFRMRSSFI
jgi:argininosuccinate lyase